MIGLLMARRILTADDAKLKIIYPILSFVIFIFLWEFVVRTGIVASRYLPAPTELVETFQDKLSNPNPEGATLGQNIISSLMTSFSGFLLAIVIGIPLGLIMGFSDSVDRFVKPIFEIIRPIPPIAWIPLTIVLLGIGFQAKVFIIFYAAFVPCVMNSYTGIKLTNKTLINVAKTCGASRMQIFFKVCLPSSLSMVFAGVRLALSASWTTLVAAEMLASSSGLGYMIQMGRMLARPDLIVLGMVVIGAIGYLISLVVGKLETAFGKWRIHR